MQSLTVSQLRANLKEHLATVSNLRELLVVPGAAPEEAVVIMSIQEYNSMQETAHLLSTAANRKRLGESLAEANRGDLKSFELEAEDTSKMQK